MMELKRLLTRATALLFQGAYQGAESFIEQAMAEADKIKSELAELDTLRTRVTEMAAEVERLQSVIDEANAQEPVCKIIRNEAGQVSIKNGVGDYFDMSKYVGFSLYASPIPAQQSPVTATDERTNEFGEPETVYLQLHDPDDGNEKSHGSNYKADGVTWCWHPINENDVRYIRADLFQQSTAVAVPDETISEAYLRGYKDAAKEYTESPRITEQDAMISGSDIYLFRRKGLEPFLTCSRERFDELSRNESFETKILYENALISAPFPHPRISEHELKLIAQSAVEYYSDHGWREGDKFWMENKGSALLNKLNGDHNGK